MWTKQCHTAIDGGPRIFSFRKAILTLTTASMPPVYSPHCRIDRPSTVPRIVGLPKPVGHLGSASTSSTHSPSISVRSRRIPVRKTKSSERSASTLPHSGRAEPGQRQLSGWLGWLVYSVMLRTLDHTSLETHSCPKSSAYMSEHTFTPGL
jgi:hypothetical protein